MLSEYDGCLLELWCIVLIRRSDCDLPVSALPVVVQTEKSYIICCRCSAVNRILIEIWGVLHRIFPSKEKRVYAYKEYSEFGTRDGLHERKQNQFSLRVSIPLCFFTIKTRWNLTGVSVRTWTMISISLTPTARTSRNMMSFGPYMAPIPSLHSSFMQNPLRPEQLNLTLWNWGEVWVTGV